jgi:hypothetical protein
MHPHNWPISERWNLTFERNKMLASQFSGDRYDVVFFGDSITEHWVGTDLKHESIPWRGINKVFRDHFTKQGGGKVDGLALGIGGDRVRYCGDCVIQSVRFGGCFMLILSLCTIHTIVWTTALSITKWRASRHIGC